MMTAARERGSKPCECKEGTTKECRLFGRAAFVKIKIRIRDIVDGGRRCTHHSALLF